MLHRRRTRKNAPYHFYKKIVANNTKSATTMVEVTGFEPVKYSFITFYHILISFKIPVFTGLFYISSLLVIGFLNL